MSTVTCFVVLLLPPILKPFPVIVTVMPLTVSDSRILLIAMKVTKSCAGVPAPALELPVPTSAASTMSDIGTPVAPQSARLNALSVRLPPPDALDPGIPPLSEPLGMVPSPVPDPELPPAPPVVPPPGLAADFALSRAAATLMSDPISEMFFGLPPIAEGISHGGQRQLRRNLLFLDVFLSSHGQVRRQPASWRPLLRWSASARNCLSQADGRCQSRHVAEHVPALQRARMAPALSEPERAGWIDDVEHRLPELSRPQVNWLGA